MRPWTLTSLYLALAVAMTWPLVRFLGVAFPGWHGDMTLFSWYVDTFWSMVAARQNPLAMTTRIFYPLGQNMFYAVGGGATVAFLAWPFWFFGGPSGVTAFFGVFVITAMVMGALGMRAAVLALTRDARAAAWAGLFFEASPAIYSMAGSPFYARLGGAVLLPWALYATLRFVEDSSWRRVVALSVLAWMVLLTDYYMAFGMLLLIAVVGVVAWRRTMLKSAVLGLVANAALAVAAVSVGVVNVGQSLDNTTGGFWDSTGANLAGLFVPGLPPQQAVGQYVHQFWLLFLAGNHGEMGAQPPAYFLGFGVCALLGVALWSGFRDRRLIGLALAAVLLVLVSCSTTVRWGAHDLLAGQWAPFSWVVRVPIFQGFDHPSSFQLAAATPILAILGLGVATALRKGSRIGHVLVAIVILLDYGQAGIPLMIYPTPLVYTALAARPRATLLEVPGGISESRGGLGLNFCQVANSEEMYWQTIHRMPRVGGYVGRVPHATFEWFFHTAVIGDILTLTGNDGAFECYHGDRRQLTRLPDYPPEVVDRFVEQFDIGYIIFPPCGQKGKFEFQQEKFEAEIDRLLGDRITKREMFDGYALYTVRR